METPHTLSVKIVEVLLYLSVGARIFGNQIGILNVTGLSGGLILVSGVICFMIISARAEKVPISVYFAVMISILATIVDLYYVDLVPRNMLFWTSILLMVCFVVRDRSAHIRCAFFLAACVFLAVWIGGTFFSGIQGIQRLGLESGAVATMFGNPNDLAQISLITALALLFLGASAPRMTRLASQAVALGLMYVVLLTLSRQGLILLGFGLAAYVLLILNLPGKKFECIFLLLTTFAVAIIFREEFMQIIDGYILRMGLDSGRIDYWKTAPHDMFVTFMTGYGTFDAFTSEGLQPHSAFLWLHLAYGGFCALVYTVWILWMGTRTMGVMFNQNLAAPPKIESMMMFCIFFALQFTGVFTPFNYGCVLAVATLEKNFALAETANG